MSLHSSTRQAASSLLVGVFKSSLAPEGHMRLASPSRLPSRPAVRRSCSCWNRNLDLLHEYSTLARTLGRVTSQYAVPRGVWETDFVAKVSDATSRSISAPLPPASPVAYKCIGAVAALADGRANTHDYLSLKAWRTQTTPLRKCP